MGQRSPDPFPVVFWLVVVVSLFFDRGHGEKMLQMIFTATPFHGDLTSGCEDLISHLHWGCKGIADVVRQRTGEQEDGYS